MPITPTYPGVYIEEIPSPVRTIAGVATSVAAFVDAFAAGPVNEAVQIFNFGDFEREFGGLSDLSEASYAIQQFFLNGGTEAWVVRVVPEGAVRASVVIANESGAAALTLAAASPGDWGNRLRARVEPTDGTTGINLLISEYGADGRTILRQEVFRNLLMPGAQARPGFTTVDKVIDDETLGSRLAITDGLAGADRPAPNGTLTDALADEGVALSANANFRVSVTTAEAPESGSWEIADLGRFLPSLGTGVNPRPAQIGPALEAAIRAAKPESPAFAGATVRVIEGRFWILPGGTEPTYRVFFDNIEGGEDTTATTLLLATGAVEANATLSGPIDPIPTLDAAAEVSCTIGETTRAVPLTLEGAAPALADIATGLEADIRGVATDASETAWAEATVRVVDDRLLIRAGTDQQPTFADASETDTTATALALTDAAGAESRTVTFSGEHPTPPSLPETAEIGVALGEEEPQTIDLAFASNASLDDIAGVLNDALQGLTGDAFTQAQVLVDGQHLLILPGAPSDAVRFANTDDITATTLRLAGAQINITDYQFARVDAIAGSFQLGGTVGTAGAEGTLGLPDADTLMGTQSAKEGIYALEDVDLFNLLCIPRVAQLPATEMDAVITAASAYCQQRRAFFLIDTPAGIADQRDVKGWLAEHETAVRATPNAAFYYPQVKIPDPRDDFRLRTVGASGTMAGIFARTDALRGVWKAPAGTEANLRNVVQLDDVLTDPENGALNPLGINCLRTFPVFGSVSWGARTVFGADQQASEWKYVPVRRLALFLEESLYRGTKWVVFEPNDEPLWAQIRLNIGAFMQNLFRQGAFQGRSPREAYFVKCDRETTTQNDIDRGIVNIVVGFAPLKPAEFVIIKFQQIAGEIQT